MRGRAHASIWRPEGATTKGAYPACERRNDRSKLRQRWRFNPFLHDRQAYLQSYRFRKAIEPSAIVGSTFRANRGDFARVRNVQKEMLDRKFFTLSGSMVFAHGLDFRGMLIRCSGNRLFIEALERQNQLQRFMEYRAATRKARLVQRCQEHFYFLDLTESSNPGRAAACASILISRANRRRNRRRGRSDSDGRIAHLKAHY